MKRVLPIIALFILGCKYPHSAIKLQPSSLQHINSSVTVVDSGTIQLIKPYADSIAGIMNAVVGTSEKELTNKRPEGLLGNFITDALYEYVKISILPKEPLCVVLNGGGLRAPLPKGDITKGRIFETLPFENTLVILKISKSQMDSVVARVLSKKGEPVSNLLIAQKNGKTEWSLKNQTEKPDYIYIITSDYLANGNDGYSFYKKSLERIETGMNLRDILLLQMQEYKRRNVPISPIIEGRIILE
jgi:2',3'-cyclic-nucleotide 2'-phosphodiesterase (5'-nucleotidase family)